MSKFTVFIKQYAKKHKFWWDLEVLIRWTLHFPMRPQKRSCEKPHSNKTDTDRLSLSCDITNLVCPDYFHTSLKMWRLKRYKAHTCYKRSTYWQHAISDPGRVREPSSVLGSLKFHYQHICFKMTPLLKGILTKCGQWGVGIISLTCPQFYRCYWCGFESTAY